MESKFIGENWIKANTPLSKTVDFEDIKSYIDPAQELIIEPIIGTLLYKRLKESIVGAYQISIGVSPDYPIYTDDEKKLLDLIRPCVAYYTVYLALPTLQTKIKNKGLVRGQDNYIQTVSKQDMLDLKQHMLDFSDFYLRRLKEFLCDNYNLYPLYKDQNNKKTQTKSDLGGFIPYKSKYTGPFNTSDFDLIKKIINYK